MLTSLAVHCLNHAAGMLFHSCSQEGVHARKIHMVAAHLGMPLRTHHGSCLGGKHAEHEQLGVVLEGLQARKDSRHGDSQPSVYATEQQLGKRAIQHI